MKNQKSVFTPVARLAMAGLLAGTLAMPLAASARVVGAALTTATGKVTAVDQASRTITLQGENGNTVEIMAGPNVRNFQQIKPGDTLTLDYYESVAVAVRPAGSGAPDGRNGNVEHAQPQRAPCPPARPAARPRSPPRSGTSTRAPTWSR
ncbi:hypothetical protein ADE_10610 [Achromobacter denitrificans]|uniref:hypothetical protein n=1 Tax=Achromobacter denitrificans TaxID=32002 RepID=UPI0019C3223A|nr:hypothetical protein [Achromobacter denitrificans]GFN25363.1 hypothetical protein ADE_10610 [Achromobacter denitrificans]